MPKYMRLKSLLPRSTGRWLAAVFAVAAFYTMPPVQANAQAPMAIIVDTQTVTMPAPPFIDQERTMVPLRAIAEAMGATVGWDQDNKAAIVTVGGAEVRLGIGQETARVNENTVPVDRVPRLVDGHTFIPLRFLAEHLGAEVAWLPPDTVEIRTARREAVSRGSSRSGEALARTSMQFLGAPYAWGGTDESGFDCSGLVWRVAKLNGITLGRSTADQATAGVTVSRDALLPGDLVFFQTYGEGPTHVWIVIDAEVRFIHSENEDTGVVITPMSKPWWSSRFLFARRIVR